MRISNKMMSNNVLSNLNKQTERLLTLQERISTGRMINRASDNPIGMAQALSYRKNIASIDQFQENIVNAQLNINMVDSILESATELLNQAKQYTNNSQSDFSSTFALQVADLREQLLGLANTKTNGNFLFAGDCTDSQPFDTDGNYSGDSGTKGYLVGENSLQIDLISDGSQIFGTAPNSIFDVLKDLETALTAGDSTAIQAQLAPITEAIDKIRTVRSIHAGKHKLLETSNNHYQNLKLNVEGLLSSVQDVDMARAVIELKVQQASYESTLATAAQIIRPSLIDFLS